MEEEKLMNEEAALKTELLEILRGDLSSEELSERMDDFHDADIADVLPELTGEERIRFYKAVGVERVSEVFSYIEDVEPYFQEIGLEKSAEVLTEMDADDAVDILENLPEEIQDQLVERLDEESKEDIELIRSYDEDEIGSLMTTNYISIRKGIGVKDAMRSLVEQAEDNDNISTIYVENSDGKFYGAIDLKDLIIARAGTDLEDVTAVSYPTVHDHALIAEEMERLRSYSEDSIPVLDGQSRLIGVITAFDVVEALDDELSEDYAKLAGLTAEEDLNEPLFASIKKRIPWLIALLALGLVVSTVVGVFEGVVQKIALVVCFQSLILDMAGNSGTQSLAVTIRVLMDEELTGKQKAGFVLKEARVGITNGILLGISSVIFVGLYITLLKGYEPGYAFTISGCVGIALCFAMFIASLVGTLIPMFFHKIHVDPAVASGPLITTTNDLIAVVTYYGLVWVLLINVLHLAN